MEVGKLQDLKASQQAGDPGEPMLKFQSKKLETQKELMVQLEYKSYLVGRFLSYSGEYQVFFLFYAGFQLVA